MLSSPPTVQNMISTLAMKLNRFESRSRQLSYHIQSPQSWRGKLIKRKLCSMIVSTVYPSQAVFPKISCLNIPLLLTDLRLERGKAGKDGLSLTPRPITCVCFAVALWLSFLITLHTLRFHII